MNSPGAIALLLIVPWLLAGVVWLLTGRGAEKVDEALAQIGVDDDEEPVPYWPATGPEDDPAWEQHVTDAITAGNDTDTGPRWTRLDDMQVARWARTHPTTN